MLTWPAPVQIAARRDAQKLLRMSLGANWLPELLAEYRRFSSKSARPGADFATWFDRG